MSFIFYFINLFLERGEGKEKKRVRNMNVWLPLTHPLLGSLSHNPGMCPDWESNQQPFGLQAGTQPLSHPSQGLWSILIFVKGVRSVSRFIFLLVDVQFFLAPFVEKTKLI